MEGFRNIVHRIRSSQSEKEVEMYYTYMNHHLNLLSGSVERGDEEGISFHKGRLEEIRKILIELEYFNFMYEEEKERV